MKKIFMMCILGAVAVTFASCGKAQTDAEKTLAYIKEHKATKPVGKDGQVIGDDALLDTDKKAGFAVDLDSFFKDHPLGKDQATRGDNIYLSPRCKIDVVTNRGPLIGLHYHASADEIVYVYKGSGEIYMNGKWTPVKAGQIHVNPRGVIHATRMTGKELMYALSIFTPPQAGGDDKIFMDGMK